MHTTYSFDLTRTDHVRTPNGTGHYVNRHHKLTERDVRDIGSFLAAGGRRDLAAKFLDSLPEVE